MLDLTKATAELFAALSAFQGEVENASKNAANPHFKSKYADLAEVLNTIREPLAKNGLSLTQYPSFDGSLASVTSVISHKTGGYIVATASCIPAKSDAQGIGSATTYLRRYSAAAAMGIAQEDDDGNSAAHNNKPTPMSEKLAGLIADVMSAPDLEELDRIGKETSGKVVSAKDKQEIRNAYSKRRAELTKQVEAA